MRCATDPPSKDAVTSLAYLTEWSRVAEEPKQKSQKTPISRPIVSAPHVRVYSQVPSAMSTIVWLRNKGFGAARQII